MMVGNRIPDMELDAYHEGRLKRIRLSDYRGQWLVLFFYPADFTLVCPTELEELADNYAAFRKHKVEILSVSTDAVEMHRDWHGASAAVGKVKFPMLADPGGKLCRDFGVYLEGEKLALRATFIIDPDGIIQAMEVHDNRIGRSAAELLRKLEAVLYVRQHVGSLCPAGWKPGAPALKGRAGPSGRA